MVKPPNVLVIRYLLFILNSVYTVTVLHDSSHILCYPGNPGTRRTQLTHSQQTESLQRQDKEYLGRQVSALTLRASEAEERAGSLSVELEQARRDRQSVYEQLMKSR